MRQRGRGKARSMPEGWAAALTATWILTNSQSDWPESRMYLIPAVADSTAVDSIQSVSCFLLSTRFCNTEAWNPIVALHLNYEWNYSLQKSLNSGFNLCRFPVVRGTVELWPTLCKGQLKKAASSPKPAHGCSGWFLAVCVSFFGFYLFEKKRSKCSLILAGGQPGSSRGWEEQHCEGCCSGGPETREANIRFFRSKCVWERFDLDLTLMSTLGMPQHYSPLNDGQHWESGVGGVKNKRKRQKNKYFTTVWDGYSKKRQTEAQRARQSREKEEDWGGPEERGRTELWDK